MTCEKERIDWIDEYFLLRCGPGSTNKTRTNGEGMRKERLEKDLKILYKYRKPAYIPDLITCLEKGAELKIHFTQPCEYYKEDPFDTYIPEVYHRVPELRRDMAKELADQLCQQENLDESHWDECRKKCMDTLSIDDWDEWIKQLSTLTLEYQSGVVLDLEGLTDEILEKFKKAHRDKNQSEQKRLGVSCFCEINSSNHMWKEYAGDHKGFCLAYDVSVFLGIPNTPTRKYANILPIRYRIDIPDLEELSVKYLRSLLNGRMKLNRNEEDALVTKIICTKKMSFCCEMEWRAVVLFNKLDEHGKPVKSDQDIPLRPCCIYLGKDIDEGHERDIRRAAGLRNIPVIKMSPDLL